MTYERIFPTDRHGNPIGPARDELVRCGDCRYYEDTGFCNWFECSYCSECQRVEPDGYCAWGARADA